MKLRIAQRVAPLKRTLIREIFESAPKDALNLGLGQPDLSAPDVLREALARAASVGPTGYGPTAGLAALREAVAGDYPEFARGPGDVLVTCGCQQAAFVTLGCLLDEGDELLVPDPGFPGSPRAALAWNAKARSYPLRPENDFHIDPDEVLGAVTDETRALLVISPSNPTGTIESAETIDALVRGTAERGIALIIDDTYRGLSWLDEAGAPGARGDELDHVIVCGGLSKSVALTGWRVGWTLCRDPELMAKLVALQQTVLTCPSTPIQEGALAAFTPAGRDAARALHARFAGRAALVERALPREKYRRAPLEGAFYAWIDASARGGGRPFAKELLEEEKIVVIPGEAFGEAYPDWIRISYAEDDAKLADALPRIAARLG